MSEPTEIAENILKELTISKPELNFCTKCLCREFVYRRKSVHIGKYCRRCETWIKWMPEGSVKEEDIEKPKTLF